MALAPAFSYAPSSSSSDRSPAPRHAPHPSEASSLASFDPRSTRSSYTSYASSSYSHDEYDEDEGSVLEDLYELSLNGPAPNTIDASTRCDSSPIVRERTRYRSSASIAPAAAAPRSRLDPDPLRSSTSSSSRNRAPTSASMDLSSFLASLPPSLDRCFCGGQVEEDSIYCSRACAQEDALNALCGGSSAEDSDRASLVSGGSSSSRGSLGSGAENHYRRIEREEVRKEKERQAKIARERSAARRKAREGNSISSAGSSQSSTSKKVGGSLWRSNVDISSVKTGSITSSVPSLSSSISSLASAPSPLSPSFPPVVVTHADSPQPPRPTTPSPPSPRGHDVADIYSSYLATTPLASTEPSKHLRTPTQYDPHHLATPRSGYPQTPTLSDDEDDSPTGRAARQRASHCGPSNVGLRMLQLCSSYPSSPSLDAAEAEELDQVATPSLGWGHRELEQRMKSKSTRHGGGGHHQKGKLSFDDVVDILS
ncbi:hypothetical protein JCM10212_004402 [Sporobolomyces blumeae]